MAGSARFVAEASRLCFAKRMNHRRDACATPYRPIVGDFPHVPGAHGHDDVPFAQPPPQVVGDVGELGDVTGVVALRRLWRPGMEGRGWVILLPLRWMSPQWQPFAMEVILVVQERPTAEPLGSLSGSPSESRIHSTFAITPSRALETFSSS